MIYIKFKTQHENENEKFNKSQMKLQRSFNFLLIINIYLELYEMKS